MTKVYEKATEILDEIKNQLRRRIVRFIIGGTIILVENIIQMLVFYDDQMEVGNSWTWVMGVMPMLSNFLFSRWCATLGPAFWFIMKDFKKYKDYRKKV